MKKATAFLLICCLCLLFTSCEPIWFEYESTELRNNVISIELISYDNPNAKTISDFTGNTRHPAFDFDRMITIGTMQPENHEGFFEDLSVLTIGNFVRQKNAPNGLCFKVNYSNGEFDIVSEDYIGRFDSEGQFVNFIGSVHISEYEKIIATYIENKAVLYA